MTIKYDKFFRIIEERKVTSYDLTKKNKIMGQATWKSICEGRHIDTRTLDRLCMYLNCQPGDLIEYVPDEDGEII